MPTISVEMSNKRFYTSMMSVELPFVTESMNSVYRNAFAGFLLHEFGGYRTERGPLRILEVGCNSGYFMEGLYESMKSIESGSHAEAAKMVEYTGIDLSQYALIKANRILEKRDNDFFRTRLLRKDLTVEDFDGKYDLIVANELFDDIGSLIYTVHNGDIYEMRPLEKVVPEGFSIVGRRFSIKCGESGARFESLNSSEKEIVYGLREGELVTVSPNSIRLLENLVNKLSRGGMLFIHDYGWVGNIPSWLRKEGVRAYGSRNKSSLSNELEELAPKFQITVDVNFSELADYLKSFGEVHIVPYKDFINLDSQKKRGEMQKTVNEYGFLNLIMRRD